MKVNLAGNAGVTLDDMVGSEKTTHIAASAFHCCLGEFRLSAFSNQNRANGFAPQWPSPETVGTDMNLK